MPRIITLATAVALLSSCEDPIRVTRTPQVAKNIVAANAMLVPTIAFTSTRDDPTASPLLAAEIYLMDADFENQRRLTVNNDGDAFAVLSPDGKKIVFDSNRLRGTGPLNTSDLFVMNTDGTQQTFLVHGGSPTWSPDGKTIAFHASASGTAPPVIGTPGAATTDSDIFLLNVDDALAGVGSRIKITNNASAIDDDPDWSPDGMKIVFTSHSVNEPNHNNAVSAELYILNADGTGTPTRLTINGEEERAPAWSPDGTRIAYSCRIGGLDFEICVLTFNQDGTKTIQQLTDNTVPDLTVSWSGDGQTLLFHRSIAGLDQLFSMKADGSEAAVQRTTPPGRNLLARWGVLRVKSE